MVKLKKLMIFICSLIMLTVGVCGCLTGCSDDCPEEKDKKYDVAIRIACSDGKVYEFPVGTDELHVEYTYDGLERTFAVRVYNLPDHPRWSEDWLTPSGEGANVFSLSILYGDGEKWLYEVDKIRERGSYSIAVIANSTSDLWNFRSVRLYVTVI